MAHTFNESNLTLNPKENSDLSKAIVEQAFSQPSLEKLHRIMTGVVMKEQIMLVGQLSRVGVKQSGCGMATSGATSALTEKFWDPAMFGDRFENCIAEMNSLFKAYFDNITHYEQMYNMDGSDLSKLLMVLLEEAISAAILRVVWFGDTAVAAATSTVAGLTDAANIKLFNVIDGLWKQIYAGVTASTITKANLGASGKLSMKNVYDASDSRLRGNKNAVFMVSRNIFDSYVDQLETASLAFELTTTTDGLQSTKYKGFEVINMETVWDKDLELFVNNSTDNDPYLPDRIVFTTRDNIPVGTLNESDLTNLESFYDKVSKKNITDFGFTIDAKVIDEKLITVAYGTMPTA